jgi:hypothetical protein
MAIRIPEFDTFRAGYASAVVTVYKANTTTEADLFADEAGTAPIDNPQTLVSQEILGVSYGKWVQPVYVGEAYELSINVSEQTGVQRYPIFTAIGLDVSKSVAKIPGSSTLREIEDHLAQLVWVEDFGILSGDAAANTAIITAAIGAASSAGGGEVLLPEGTIVMNNITVGANVHLKGRGIGVTVLQSTFAGVVVTISGERGGLESLTLDGVSAAGSSVGVKATNVNLPWLRDVLVKRFERGVYLYGSSFSRFRELYVTDCTLQNFLAESNSAASGAKIQFIEWDGGECSGNTTVTGSNGAGASFDYADLENSFIHLKGIRFNANAGTALMLDGARFVYADHCEFTANTDDVLIRNANGVVQTDPIYKIQSVKMLNCYFDAGTFKAQDDLNDVVLESCDIRGVAFTLTTPKRPILLVDCKEDNSVTIAGDGTKLARFNRNLDGSVRGVTTGNVATKAMSLVLEPGEMCTALVMVTGKQRNGIDKATYVFTFTAQKAPSTLAYDNQTTNFTVGDVVTGGTSGASGRVIADADGGATGTLTLHTITGAFIDNEIITGAISGSAQVNGALVAGSVTILDQDMISTSETDATWLAQAAGTVDEAEVQVTGAAAKTIDWLVSMRPMRGG